MDDPERSLLTALALLSGCVHEDIARRFVVEDSARSLSLVESKVRIFGCAVAVYRAPSAAEPPALVEGFEPWSTAPLATRVNETAIEMRALSNAGECWGEEVRKVSGSSDPWRYLEATKPMISFDHSGHVAVFDARRAVFIAITG